MTTPTRIKTFLIVSAILMIVGHWAVMHSGAVFDPSRGEYYNVDTRWVSDFAAKWPEGLWIKGSIVLFCMALIDFIRLVILRFSDNRYAGLWKFWWLLLATALIGGLLLVILFDMSPTQYRHHEPSWLAGIFGDRGYLESVPRTPTDWVKQGHHRIGFLLFVSGFFLSAISLAWAELRSGLRSELPTTAFLLLFAAGLSIWLFFMKEISAGIPQRALLVLIFIWVFRNLSIITRVTNKKA